MKRPFAHLKSVITFDRYIYPNYGASSKLSPAKINSILIKSSRYLKTKSFSFYFGHFYPVNKTSFYKKAGC